MAKSLLQNLRDALSRSKQLTDKMNVALADRVCAPPWTGSPPHPLHQHPPLDDALLEMATKARTEQMRLLALERRLQTKKWGRKAHQLDMLLVRYPNRTTRKSINLPTYPRARACGIVAKGTGSSRFQKIGRTAATFASRIRA